MNKLVILAAVLTLSGCAEATKRVNAQAARDACQGVPSTQFNACVNRQYNRIVAEDEYNRSREVELTTLGGAAFINGYNMNRRQPVATCYRTGMMTQCY